MSGRNSIPQLWDGSQIQAAASQLFLLKKDLVPWVPKYSLDGPFLKNGAPQVTMAFNPKMVIHDSDRGTHNLGNLQKNCWHPGRPRELARWSNQPISWGTHGNAFRTHHVFKQRAEAVSVPTRSGTVRSGRRTNTWVERRFLGHQEDADIRQKKDGLLAPQVLDHAVGKGLD